MKKLNFAFFFILFSGFINLYSQRIDDFSINEDKSDRIKYQDTCIFRARLIDANTSLPVNYAEISSIDKKLYIISNSSGEFQIPANNLPLKLRIRKFGYKDENVIIESAGTTYILLIPLDIYRKNDYRIKNQYAAYLNIAVEKLRKKVAIAAPDPDQKELVYCRITSSVDSDLASLFESYSQMYSSGSALQNFRTEVARFSSSGKRVPGISGNKLEYNIESYIKIPSYDLERYVHNIGYFEQDGKRIAIVRYGSGRYRIIYYIDLADTSIVYIKRSYKSQNTHKLPVPRKTRMDHRFAATEISFSPFGNNNNNHRIDCIMDYESIDWIQKDKSVQTVSKNSIFNVIPDHTLIHDAVKEYVFNESLSRPKQQINYNSKYSLTRKVSLFDIETQKLSFKPYSPDFWVQNALIHPESWQQRQIQDWEHSNQFYSENRLPPVDALTRIDSLIEIMNNNIVSVENVYIEHDRPDYLIGDTIWFSAFVLDNLFMDTTFISKFLYVDLINPENILQEHLKLLIKNGRAKGDFILNKGLKSGIFRIRAYTQWMRNFQGEYLFEKDIPVLPASLNDLIAVNPMINKSSDGDSINLYLQTLLPSKYKILPKKLEVNVRLNDSMNVRKSFNFKDQFYGILGFFVPDSLLCFNADVHLILYDTAIISDQRLSLPLGSGIDLKFFPESGKMVAGINTVIAYKAVDNKGIPAEFDADIVDENQNIVKHISGNKSGIGKFGFTPQYSQVYKAVVTLPGEKYLFNLPVTEPNGYILNFNTDSSSIIIKNNQDIIESRHYLLLSQRGAVCTAVELNFSNDSLQVFLPFKTYPKGIIQISLYDSLFRPLAERLVFNNRRDKKMLIHSETDKLQYLPKEKVNMTIRVSDAYGNPVESSLVLSVVDASKTDTLAGSADIESYLYFASELKGKIDYTLFNLADTTIQGKQNIDLLMMTQGWRNYLWNSIRFNKTLKDVYSSEGSFYVKGRLLNEENKIPDKDYWLYLFEVKSGILEPGEIVAVKMDSVKISKSGNFYFEFPQFYGSRCLLIQNINEKGRADDMRFRLDTISTPGINIRNNELPYISYKSGQLKSMTEKISEIDSLNAGIKYILIPEIIVRSKIPRFYSSPDITVELDKKDPTGNKYSNIYQMIYQEFGEKAFTSPNGLRISPTILVNGLKNNYGMDIPVNEVFYVAFYEAGSNYSRFFGVKSVGDAFHDYAPVISLQVYSNWYRGAPLGAVIIPYQGIYQAREFYTPNYEVDKNTRSDNRTTIYWNPEVKIDSTGNAKVSFYNSDLKGKALIRISGVSYYLGDASAAISHYISY